jgi:hypothetical protein
VEALRVELLSQPHGLASPLDVGQTLALGVRGHVVDGGQVEEVIDLAPEIVDHLLAAELLLREVTDHRDDAALLRAPAAPQLLEPAAGALSHQDVDRPLTLEQLLDQVAAYETGRAGYEVAHLTSPSVSRAQAELTPSASSDARGFDREGPSAIIKLWGSSTTRRATPALSGTSA